VRQSQLIIDLFCGCGGFSLGAHLAGFETLLAIDIDRTLSSSVTKNFPNVNLLNEDVSAISLVEKGLIGDNKISGIIGGPPCQGFSAIGKRHDADPRNLLVGHFFRHVREVSPSFFVMENVPGILEEGSKEVLDAAVDTVRDLYEIVGPITLDASYYGAATTRTRVIVVGYKVDQCDRITEEDFKRACLESRPTVHDAIFDLPGAVCPEQQLHGFEWAAYGRSRKAGLSEYAKRARASAPEGLGWQIAKDMLKKGSLSGNQLTVHSEAIAKRYREVPGGKRDSISKSFKLMWGSQCPTLRAGTGPDHGSFNAVRPLHPDVGRVITVREAARLQGFPDCFIFHPTKWHSFRMIGNSVSPYVSKAVLGVIREKLGLGAEGVVPDAA
jgi:DNA (cytosine-5)-methyltransferase 1